MRAEPGQAHWKHDDWRSDPQVPRRPPRSRLRTFLPLGFAAWLVLEIWLLTVVAGASSGFVVFLLLVAGVVLGSVVIKAAGRRAFRSLQETVRSSSPASCPEPCRAATAGNGLMMLGGLLIIIPA